ncbi:SMR family transporter [Glaciecola sp. MF2-115]|uniref:SMR family transporter n=1 Tax=Glaciecola sp. MF2-115 TaxID=3384827 RepID=UPI0039A1ECCA
MTINIILFIISSVSLSAFAQIVLKMGMSNAKVQNDLMIAGNLFEKLFIALTNVYVVAGISMYLLSMVLWLVVLSKIDVSVAYPFVGLGFIITMVLGFLLLNEQISAMRVMGTILVVCGVLMVSSTQS